MDNQPNFSTVAKLQWAGSREKISPSGRGGAFFLTSLFIELIDRWALLNECHDDCSFRKAVGILLRSSSQLALT